METRAVYAKDVIKQKETGRGGLTNQTRDLLKILEAMYGIYWERNQQNMGSKKGRPDFECILADGHNGSYMLPQFYAIELKAPGKKLHKHQERERERIEIAGGHWHTCTTIEEVAQIFWNLGYKFELS